MQPSEAVLRFLASIGRRSEAEFYLELFRAEPRERFAAIAIDARVAEEAYEAVLLDLRYLALLGLLPVVLLGVFEPEGARGHAIDLEADLQEADVAATLLSAADEALARRAASTIRAGRLPLVAFGEPVTQETHESCVSRDLDRRFARVGELLTALRTRKLIFLRPGGPLRQRGAPISLVNLATDYDPLIASDALSIEERQLVVESRRLVADAPHKLVVSITSPLDLLRELFTVKGAGTLLRRGARIEQKRGYDELDLPRLRALLASSFGRAPDERFFDRPVARIHLEEHYRGVAIVTDTPLGAYLTKFAVEPEAQGEGLGRDLFAAAAAEHPTLHWRARAGNPIGAWYATVCDGLCRFADWHVYWRGLEPARIPDAIAHALAQPVDFPPSGS